MKLTDADVEEIVRILDASPYRELELETDRFRLVLRRGDSGVWSRQRETIAEPNVDDTVVEEAVPNKDSKPDSGAADDRDEDLLSVRAPIVGTFYRAPSPGAKPFVEQGSRVEPDTVVAIIEVMKLMNSVTAGLMGEVVEICVDNAAQVEQDQVLMRVRPDSA